MADNRQFRLLVACSARARLAAVSEWLDALPPSSEALIIAPTRESGDEMVRKAAMKPGARFGLGRITLDRLAVTLAAPVLARNRRTPASRFSLVAVAARVVHLLNSRGAITYFQPVAKRPGLAEAVTRTLEELRLNGVSPEAVKALPRIGTDLAAFGESLDQELRRTGLADRAAVFEAAIEALTAPDRGGGTLRFAEGLPLALIDLPVGSRHESDLLAAVARRAGPIVATAPYGDSRAIEHLERVLGCRAETIGSPSVNSALTALQTHLFEETAPPSGLEIDSSVSLLSWPGEARECVEIARSIQSEAARGIGFDRMAVFLRSPAEYRPHLEEAFRRAAIPAYFSRGTSMPDPGGRALLALLACATEKLSARRFAEYVSLAQVPDEPPPDDETWFPPEHELMPVPQSMASAVAPLAEATGGQFLLPFDSAPVESVPKKLEKLRDDPDSVPVIDGTLRAPWRWEQLLVEASVIGGRDRWARRLNGLGEELKRRRDELAGEDEARASLLARELNDLRHLTAFALPLIDRLAQLPERATWGEWLKHLRNLATTALREPENVLATLAELEPAALVGPIDIDEVQLVLAPRLRELSVPPPRRRYGAVFVGSAETARGLSFEVVFIPGLAEKLFPRKVVEDPVLLDAERELLGVPTMTTQSVRVATERLALRLGVGAAASRVFLSYPRVDMEQARPRVPSFYGLEAVRAVEGSLPGFEDLGRRAERGATGRLGWPAPDEPKDAIDEAEYDLALLGPLLHIDEAANAGTATYLLSANPHLARALRARARRWLRRWTQADGLVDPGEIAAQALGRHQLSARSFSPTALQNFSICPYRFFLQAIHRLEPREDPVAIEVIDPLTRGSLFHDAQFEILTRLKSESLLPLEPANLDRARQIVEEAVTGEAARYEDELAPAIPRVWEDGINSIRADLREWLRRMAEEPDDWLPHRFELSFGLADRDRRHEDPASVAESVPLVAGLQLRGSIDLVERHPKGTLRATDHKTGKARAKTSVIFGGGAVLQPVFYGLACEKLLDEPVESGRLYYCTADGGFEKRLVPIDNYAREGARQIVETIGRALEIGFFPAYPDKHACEWCDYRPVCGPREELRVLRKPKDRLDDLMTLRSMP
jgi:RecB family exonuclease